MSTTISGIISNTDSYIGDTSNNSVTAAERLQYITEATIWLQEELQNDLQNVTSTIDYFDTVNYYKVTTTLADLLQGADLRIQVSKDHDQSFAHKSSREVAEEIGQGETESSWAIERRDGDSYLVINHGSKHQAKLLTGFDSTTDGGGTWAVDATNSDATNLTIDTNELKQGSGSFNFDMDIDQSATSSKLQIVNSTLNEVDLTNFEDISSFLFWAFIPDVTNFTSFDSFKLYWGSDTSNYWSATVTTDIDGADWITGWNRVKVNWADATKTGTPDVAAIDYIQIDLNYTSPTADDTDFRLDELIVVRPEKLTFHYQSWYVGTNTSGTDITVFGATTDVPYFSGQYDQYKFPVAHKAASLILYNLRLKEEAFLEQQEAERTLKRAKKIIPKSVTPEVKSFKVHGVRLNK